MVAPSASSETRCQCCKRPCDDSGFLYCLFCGTRLKPRTVEAESAEPAQPAPRARTHRLGRIGLILLVVSFAVVALANMAVREVGVIDASAFAAGYLVPWFVLSVLISPLFAKRWDRRFLIACSILTAFACASTVWSLAASGRLPYVTQLWEWWGAMTHAVPQWVWTGFKIIGLLYGIAAIALVLGLINSHAKTVSWLESEAVSLHDRASHVTSILREQIPQTMARLEERIAAMERLTKKFSDEGGWLQDVEERLKNTVPLQHVLALELQINRSFFEGLGLSKNDVTAIGAHSDHTNSTLLICLTIEYWKSHQHFVFRNCFAGEERRLTNYGWDEGGHSVGDIRVAR